MGFASTFFYLPQLFGKKIAPFLAWPLLICFCAIYFQRFPSLGFRPHDVIGDFNLTPKMLKHVKSDKVLLVSNHLSYRLYNFKYLMEIGGPSTQVIRIDSEDEFPENVKDYDIFLIHNYYGSTPERQRRKEEEYLLESTEFLKCHFIDVEENLPNQVFLKYCQQSE